MQRERERLTREREAVFNQQQVLQEKLAEINREMQAIDAYESTNNYSSYHTVIVTVGTLPVSCAVDAVLTANIFAVAGMVPRNALTSISSSLICIEFDA